MKILVLNSGSSSVKYKVYEIRDGQSQELAGGQVERIGLERSDIKCDCVLEHVPSCAARMFGEPGELDIPDHSAAVSMICSVLTSYRCGIVKDISEIEGIGHRVVHGGEDFAESTIIDEAVTAGIERCSRLAPLHNPPALRGIEGCKEAFEDTPQVAVFDTAFHHTIPKKAYLYGIPMDLYREHGIRKYGFHGTSHLYVAGKAIEMLDKPAADTKVITCHLGNGSSVTAVKGGESIDTSMGMTPLEGVMMGSRSGDLDPAIPLFLVNRLGVSPEEVDRLLNKDSGVKGICGLTDFRDIDAKAAEGDEPCRLALEMFAYRVARYIGAYAMAMDGVDAIVFTAGIGENNWTMRERILEQAGHLGVQLDKDKNAANEAVVSTPDSQAQVFVIPTNEEFVIARDTARLVMEHTGAEA